MWIVWIIFFLGFDGWGLCVRKWLWMMRMGSLSGMDGMGGTGC